LTSDYTTTALLLTWADGDVANKTVTVTVIDDVATEAAETVTLTLGAPNGGATLGMPALATLTIAANDAAAGSLQFTPAAPDQSAIEGGVATFTVARTGGSAGAVSTTIALGGSATLAGDYTTGALTLSWADGDVANKTISVTVVDDATAEGAETVSLTLGAPTGGAVLGAPAAATLTIQASDNAAGTISFASLQPNQSVLESAGTVTYTFSRSGGGAGAVSVTVTLGGTAANPADYGNSATTLTWADGDTADKTLSFTIVDDAVVEASETITLALGAPSGGAVVGAPGGGTLTILDNDSVAGVPTQPITVPASSPWMLALLALLVCVFVARALPATIRR
jgi:hypothetical protein